VRNDLLLENTPLPAEAEKGTAIPKWQGPQILRNPQELPQYDFLLNADALHGLRQLRSQSVDSIVCSPPYFGQRDYGVDGQVGTEEKVEDYIDRLVMIFREARRVLKDEGTFWLNLGDKYIDGQLAGAPWRTAIALQNDGWLLRSDIIWHKPNAMPSSAKNRPTTDHEYVFLFSKTSKYFYDADAIREPHVTFSEKSRMRGGRAHLKPGGTTPELGKNSGNQNLHRGTTWDKMFHEKGRNKRTVWQVSLSKFREAHFAVFPEKLVEPCVLAGCPVQGTVLDPFFGSGTTGVVALRNNRHFVGIDLNADYCKIALKRLKTVEPKLL
jgi:DNA modification methylase